MNILGRWLRSFRPLTGAPRVRRLKTYAAQTGFVYEYCYLGRRRWRGGAEYVFDISTGRAGFAPFTVHIGRGVLDPWEEAHRKLADQERYAIAKLALFQAFDDGEGGSPGGSGVEVRASDAAVYLETLGID